MLATTAETPAPPVDSPPGRARRSPRPSLGGAIGLLLAVVAFTVASRPLGDNSFLTHLATGRLILTNWSVPSTDPYSFTAAGEPWVVQSWLASVAYAGLEDLLGLWAVRLLNGVLGAAVVAALWAVTAPVRSLAVRVGLVVFPLGIGTLLWHPRPLMFGLAGLALVMTVLSGRLSGRWLLPVLALWAATHGSFPLGLAFVAAAAVGTALDDRRLPVEDLRRLGWACLGTLTVLLGPLGPTGLWFPVRLLSQQESLRPIVEWQPPRYDTPAEQLFLLLVVGTLVVFGRHRPPWRSLLPAGLAIALGLTALRNLPVASVVLVWALVPALCRMRDRGPAADARNPLANVLTVAACVLALVTASALPASGPLQLDDYPVDELAQLEAMGLIGDGQARLLTNDVVGNYLTLRHGAGARVFMDDRVDMYPPALVRDYVTLHRGGDVGPVLDRWGLDVVLWRADTPLRHWLELNPAWERVELELDGDAPPFVAFCRQGGPGRSCS